MGVKFSEIERVSERKLIIENGKPYWEEHILSGEIKFKSITEELVKSLNDDVVKKISGKIADEDLAYILIPIVSDVENDIDLERFKKMISEQNIVAITLYEGVLDMFDGMIDFAHKANDIVDKAKAIEEKVPDIQKVAKQILEQQIDKLYEDFAKETDRKKRDEILKKVIELKSELGE